MNNPFLYFTIVIYRKYYFDKTVHILEVYIRRVTADVNHSLLADKHYNHAN